MSAKKPALFKYVFFTFLNHLPLQVWRWQPVLVLHQAPVLSNLRRNLSLRPER